MNSEIAIKVENISKCFRIGLKEKLHDSVGGALVDFIKSPLRNYRNYKKLFSFQDTEDTGFGLEKEPSDVIWALKNISFEMKQGDVLGIIGKNGTGKSTLLKILSRITSPTKGRALIYGRVSSLLEVGTGFHPELTGRENIYLNGSVLGMKKSEINRKFDEIVEFSGVEKFVDTPVKRFSSGMKLRLAFAVAAHLEPEILIVDEVLAVGDAEFQKKCLGKMQDISTEGRTILFVSHNMGAVLDLCPNSLLLRNGNLVANGPSKEIVENYLSSLFQPVDNMDLQKEKNRKGNGRLCFSAVYLQNEGGDKTAIPVSGRPTDIVLEFFSREELLRVQFMLTIFNHMGVAVTHCHVDSVGLRFDLPKGQGRAICRIPKLPLPCGNYKIAVAASIDSEMLDLISTATIFDVEASNFFPSTYTPSIRYSTALVEHSWEKG